MTESNDEEGDSCRKNTIANLDPPCDTSAVNPFVHRLQISSSFEKFKTGVMSVLVLPLRVAAICGLLVLAWCIACLGLYGLTEEQLRSQPLMGWRRKLRKVIATVGELTYRIGGMSIKVKGRQASRTEAPILVVAPHSSFLDAVVAYVTGYPSIIARWESGLNPWLGKLINYTQPVYVWRDDADSRQSTIREITERATSDKYWPQILIFPEATCTNRTCLIKFKCGAFMPGVPIQPVCIRYPNNMDTVTWTWEGPGALKILWLTLTRLHSNCEIEFLPVYRPSPEEKSDPKLYANNVRKLMASTLGVPVTDYTYDHCRLISAGQRLHLRLGRSLVEIQRLRDVLGLEDKQTDIQYLSRPLDVAAVSYQQFADRLRVSPSEPALRQLFDLCDNGGDRVDWVEYLLAVLVIVTTGNFLSILQHMFLMWSAENSDGEISEKTFNQVVPRVFSWNLEKSTATYRKLAAAEPLTFSRFASYLENLDDSKLNNLLGDGHRGRLKSE